MNSKENETPLDMSADELLEKYRDLKRKEDEMADGMTAQEALGLFKMLYITDKDGILQAIDTQKDIWVDVQKYGKNHSPEFYDRLFDLLKDFREEVELTYLFDELPDWWAYSIYVDTSGISLHLDYYADEEARPHLPFENSLQTDYLPDQTFELFKVESRLLKVEEYAKLFNIEPPAVRQRIRRGKLPEVKKYGREWRIPELCDINGRDYFERVYYWYTELTDLPKGYEFLNEYSRVFIRRDTKDKQKFIAGFLGGSKVTIEEKKLNVQEREQLEMVLISNPFVHVDSECIANITQKSGEGVFLDSPDESDDSDDGRRDTNEK